ncbi:MAG: hypothetical protein WBP26_00105 [Candidatus Saccharimonadales bacterium]
MSVVVFGFAPLYKHAGLASAGKKRAPRVKCVVLHTGGMQETRRFEQLSARIHQQAGHHTTLHTAKSKEGERLRLFYGLASQQLPAMLVVGEGGALLHHWTKEQIPAANEVGFLLRQLGTS